MSGEQLFNVAASILACAACLVFVVVFHLRVTWWRTDVGRNLMALAVVLAMLFAYTVLVSVWPDGCLAMVLRWVRGVIAVAVAVIMVQRTWVFLRTQREHRDRTGV
ncbi:putative phage holin [Streptomyces tauricus]